jgi:hypothetical protein
MSTEAIAGITISLLGSVGLAIKATAVYFVRRLEHYQSRTETALADCEKKHEECDEKGRQLELRLARLEGRMEIEEQRDHNE